MNKKRKTFNKYVLSLALSACMGMSFLPASALAASNEQIKSPRQMMPSLAPMLENVLPAVVSIKTEGTTQVKTIIPPEFQKFFGVPENQSKSFTGQGSGVIVDAEKGFIVTNNHVIENADKILVQTNNGSEYTAKLVGRDPQTDIALLQIENAKDLIALQIADSDKIRVGDYAVAIGNPFGIGQTVTSGIISALARTGFNLNGFENFIQTDASINQGNSGGALINLNGELVGINTAIFAPNGGNIGIGFAIPSNIVKSLVDQFVNYGEAKRGFLGIRGNELTPDIAKAFNLDVQKGAFISEVLEDSAASEAGIKAGDVIISMNGNAIASFAELRARVATAAINKDIPFVVIRDGKRITLQVKLKQRDEQVTEAKVLHANLEGATLTDGSLKDTLGVMINKVEKGSPASYVGFAEGDLIIGVNRTKISNLADLRKIIDSKPSVVALNILRGNAQMYFILR